MTWEGLTPPYRTIVADPPWDYPGQASHLGGSVKSIPFPYSTMSVEEIAALPVADLASEDAWLFLWTTNKYLPAAFVIAKAWGFGYRQTLVWHKVGCPSPFGGTVAPIHAEFLLVAARGRPKAGERQTSSVIQAPRSLNHSQKPDVFMDIIERVGVEPRVELFARRQRLGWHTWGYGYEQEAS